MHWAARNSSIIKWQKALERSATDQCGTLATSRAPATSLAQLFHRNQTKQKRGRVPSEENRLLVMRQRSERRDGREHGVQRWRATNQHIQKQCLSSTGLEPNRCTVQHSWQRSQGGDKWASSLISDKSRKHYIHKQIDGVVMTAFVRCRGRWHASTANSSTPSKSRRERRSPGGRHLNAIVAEMSRPHLLRFLKDGYSVFKPVCVV